MTLVKLFILQIAITVSLLPLSLQAGPLETNANTDTKTIVIVGDSLSAGFGIKAEQSWPALLQKRLTKQNAHYRVVNASITGDTTRGGLSRLPELLKREQPDIVILELGGNDGLRGFSLKLIRKNLSDMIELSQKAGADVLLMGVRLPVNYGKKFRKKFEAVFIELASQHQTGLVPMLMKNVSTNPQLMQKDGIHPSAAGQPVMLENIWPELLPLLNRSKPVNAKNNE